MAGGITRVVLEGRLDIEGAATVDSQMSAIAGSSKRVLIDLQKVSYLGSKGLHTLVSPAQTVIEAEAKSSSSAPTKWWKGC